jgi:hypothetical protein
MPSTEIENYEPSDEGWGIVVGRLAQPPPPSQPRAAQPVSGRTRARHTRRGWRGWKKHIVRVVRRRRPDDPSSWIGTWALLAVGLLGLYFAGTVGLIAVVVLLVLAAFAIGLAIRGVNRVVRRSRSRTSSPTKSRIDAGSRTDQAEESDGE